MAKRSDLMSCDVYESSQAYTVKIDLPGCPRDRMQVYVEDGYLKVSADLRRDPAGRALQRERFTGKCERSFYVGDIETQDVKASYQDGVLKLTIPKSAYEKHSRTGSVVID